MGYRRSLPCVPSGDQVTFAWVRDLSGCSLSIHGRLGDCEVIYRTMGKLNSLEVQGNKQIKRMCKSDYRQLTRISFQNVFYCFWSRGAIIQVLTPESSSAPHSRYAWGSRLFLMLHCFTVTCSEVTLRISSQTLYLACSSFCEKHAALKISFGLHKP